MTEIIWCVRVFTATEEVTMDVQQAPDRRTDTKEGMNKWLLTFIKLVGLEFVLSVIFIVLGYIYGSGYFHGVGIGLLIAWVTGAVAIVVVRRRA